MVADAGDQVQQAQRGLERRFAIGRQRGWIRKADAFDEFGTVVERVDELHLAIGTGATHETKRGGLAWITQAQTGGDLAHSTISAAGSRRL